MNPPPVDEQIKKNLDEKLIELENHFSGDIFSYYGPFIDETVTLFLEKIEQLSKDTKNKNLYILEIFAKLMIKFKRSI